MINYKSADPVMARQILFEKKYRCYMANNDDKQVNTKLFAVLDVFGNIFFLNILFFITSLPIVTIGASLTAMYSVSLRMVRKEEGHIASSYFDAFKANFKKATISWIIVLIIAFLILVEYLFGINAEGPLATFYAILAIIEVLLLSMIMAFLFPMISRYENKISNYFFNSLLLSISNLGSYIKIFLLWFVPALICIQSVIVRYSIWYLWMLLLFALLAYCSSFSINKVFNRIDEASGKAKEEKKKVPAKKWKIERKKDLKSHLIEGPETYKNNKDKVETKE